MPKFDVTVTGTWNIVIDADNQQDAERLAYIECLNSDLDVELMNLEFEAFEGEDEDETV
jgi:hypothetical protein